MCALVAVIPFTYGIERYNDADPDYIGYTQRVAEAERYTTKVVAEMKIYFRQWLVTDNHIGYQRYNMNQIEM
jgi:hypothetical protein